MTAKTFFSELEKLVLIEPKPQAHILFSENCEQGEHIYYSKNLIYCFDCLKCSDSIYLYDSVMSNNCIDCDYTNESELCYESVGARKCFNSEYLENCRNLRDSSFCYGCIDCNDLIGCSNLKNKSYCIFNRQLSEEEYKKYKEKLKNVDPEKILEELEKLKLVHPLTQTYETNSENCPYGNYVNYSKDCYMTFDSSHNEKSGYLYDTNKHKTSFDVTYSSENEVCYEIVDSGQSFNSNYIVYSAHCQDSSYLINCYSLKNCLGCVGLAHQQYCILNRQFTKEEYERISSQILSELKRENLGWAQLVY